METLESTLAELKELEKTLRSYKSKHINLANDQWYLRLGIACWSLANTINALTSEIEFLKTGKKKKYENIDIEKTVKEIIEYQKSKAQMDYKS